MCMFVVVNAMHLQNEKIFSYSSLLFLALLGFGFASNHGVSMGGRKFQNG